MYQKRKSLETILVICVDVLAVTISMIMAYFLRYHQLLGIRYPFDQLWMLAMALLLYLVSFFMIEDNTYFFRRGLLEEFIVVLKGISMTVLGIMVLLYLMHRSGSASRLMLGYFFLISLFLLNLSRYIFKKYMIGIYRKSRFSSRMLLVTKRKDAEQIIENILSYQEWYREISGLVIIDGKQDEPICGIETVASLKSLVYYTLHNNVDEVFFAVETSENNSYYMELIEQLQGMGVAVNVNIDEFNLGQSGKRSLGRVGKYAVVTFERNIFTARDTILKRLLDICGSLVGMLILAVVSVFLIPAIKLDSPGPVIFSQIRMGKNGRKFRLYKFRSMYIDAEERKKELLSQNEMQGLMFKMEDDPRITKVGKFIRKTSLDELPQFWNILKGDMSLVGTRPPTVDEYEQYEAKHKCRLSMTPGLTGMWQISGRSDITDFDEVVRLDMEYIDDWSLKKDIKILFQTVRVVLTGKGSR